MKANYVSLAPFLLWKDLPRPTPWGRIFGRDAPLCLEIGFGNGEFLVQYALEHEDQNILGVEQFWPSMRRCLKRLSSSGACNVRVLQVDVRVALEWLFEPGSLHRIISLFPCPWPKKKHAHHRLFGGDFLRLLCNRMRDQAELLVVSDWIEYRDWILNQVPDCLAVRSRPVAPLFGTKYERKWVGEGRRTFHEISFRREKETSWTMRAEVALENRRMGRFDAQSLRPFEDSREGIAVVAKEWLFDPVQQRALVRVLVSEEPLVQSFWVEIARESSPDGWVVRPAQGCGMVPTAGVQRALDLCQEMFSARLA